MKVLVACEYSGTVRDAFLERGHDAWSCDFEPPETPGNHYQGNVFDIIYKGWDILIGHPPCTYLTISANKWYKQQSPRDSGTLVGYERYLGRIEAAKFFIDLYFSNIPKVCLENPVGVMSGFFRKPDQVIQPWMFGHGETKATCLWLKGLSPLVWSKENNLFHTKTSSDGREQRLHKLPPSKDRWKERSRTFSGIAKAMAEQWG